MHSSLQYAAAVKISDRYLGYFFYRLCFCFSSEEKQKHNIDSMLRKHR